MPCKRQWLNLDLRYKPQTALMGPYVFPSRFIHLITQAFCQIITEKNNTKQWRIWPQDVSCRVSQSNYCCSQQIISPAVCFISGSNYNTQASCLIHHCWRHKWAEWKQLKMYYTHTHTTGVSTWGHKAAFDWCLENHCQFYFQTWPDKFPNVPRKSGVAL